MSTREVRIAALKDVVHSAGVEIDLYQVGVVVVSVDTDSRAVLWIGIILVGDRSLCKGPIGTARFLWTIGSHISKSDDGLTHGAACQLRPNEGNAIRREAVYPRIGRHQDTVFTLFVPKPVRGAGDFDGVCDA